MNESYTVTTRQKVYLSKTRYFVDKLLVEY